MAVTTWIGQGAITLKIGSTQYESSITGFKEILSTQGGTDVELADGSIIRTNEKSTVTKLEVTCVQSVAAADMFRYLRETASASATLILTGTGSATPGVNNPKWTYAVTGWSIPPIEYSAGSNATPVATFTVSGNPTVATS